MSSVRPDVSQVLARLAAGVVGGWAFTWGFVTLGIVALVAVGMSYHDAELLVYLLAFLLYLALLCWAFAVRSLARLWLTIGGGAALMSGAAWLAAGAMA